MWDIRVSRRVYQIRRSLREVLSDVEVTWFATLFALSLFFSGWLVSGILSPSPIWYSLLIVCAGLILNVRRFVVISFTVVSSYIFVASSTGWEPQSFAFLSFIFNLIAIMLWNARKSSHLGVSGSKGEEMLVDLRKQLTAQGKFHAAPNGWNTGAHVRSVGETSFSGDFYISHYDKINNQATLALVDVAGKGVDAGTRSLSLSGAFGGILVASAGKNFLAAANHYVSASDWEEAFATALWIQVDYQNGNVQYSSAGHTPLLCFRAATNTWEEHYPTGPALGVIDDFDYEVTQIELQDGDLLLLYTDGVVESAVVDLEEGIEALKHNTARMLEKNKQLNAEELVRKVRYSFDDKALIFVQRTKTNIGENQTASIVD